MVRMTMCHEPTIIMNLILYTQSQKEKKGEQGQQAGREKDLAE